MSGDLPAGDRPAGNRPAGDPAPSRAEADGNADVEGRRRACLRCGGGFESAWSGERICGRCKESVAWRQGLPYRSNHDRRD